MKEGGERQDILLARLRNQDVELARLRDENRRLKACEGESGGEAAALRERVQGLQVTLEEMSGAIRDLRRQMIDIISGKGPVVIDGSVRDGVVEDTRNEYEARIREMKAKHEDEQSTLRAKVGALESVIVKLASGDGEALKDPEIRSLVDAVNRDKSDAVGMSGAARIKHLENHASNLARSLYGQKAESRIAGRNTVDADSADLAGEDVPESTYEISDERLGEIARNVLAQARKKPRRKHPLVDEDSEEHTRTVFPKDLPEGARMVGTDKTLRISYVSGYFKYAILNRPRFKDDKGRYYQAPVTDKNVLGHCEIDESVISEILHKHFVEHVTIGEIERWLQASGLNFSHSTVMGWISKVAGMLEPLDKPLQDAITSGDMQNSDETHLLVRDVAIDDGKKPEGRGESAPKGSFGPSDGPPEKSGGPDREREHYYGRWLFCHASQQHRLVQYVFFKQGRRNREAIQDYLKDVDHHLFLTTDGAPLYKCYDVGGEIVRVACAVHMRRAFWRLKGTSEEAVRIVDLFDQVFHQEKVIKETFSDKEKRLAQRKLLILPILNEIKNHLDKLERVLERESDEDLLKATKYVQKEFPCLLHCLEDADLDWSNNYAERQIRNIAAYRNASMFVGSPDSARRFARIISLAQSCRMNNVLFKDYVADVLRRLGNTPGDELAKLLPNQWKPQAE